MRIVGPGKSPISTLMRRGATEPSEPETPQTASHALIAVEAPAPNERATMPARRPSAAFVAQLIATRMQAPQTRARRRAEPEEAMAVYRSMTKPVAQRRSFGRRV